MKRIPPLNTTIYWSNWNKPTCIDSSVKVWSSSLNLFLSLSTPQDPKERLGCHPQTGFADITGHPFFRNVDWDLVSVFSVVLKGGRPGLLLTVKYSRIYGFPESLRSIFLFTTSCAVSESGRRVNVSQPAVIFTSVVWQQLGRDRRDLFSQRALGEGQLVTVSGQISLPPPPPHKHKVWAAVQPLACRGSSWDLSSLSRFSDGGGSGLMMGLTFFCDVKTKIHFDDHLQKHLEMFVGAHQKAGGPYDHSRGLNPSTLRVHFFLTTRSRKLL